MAVGIKAQKAAEEALLKTQTMFLVTILMFSPGQKMKPWTVFILAMRMISLPRKSFFQGTLGGDLEDLLLKEGFFIRLMFS